MDQLNHFFSLRALLISLIFLANDWLSTTVCEQLWFFEFITYCSGDVKPNAYKQNVVYGNPVYSHR